MVCPKCNNEVTDEYKFCPNCGAEMDRPSIKVDQKIGTVKGTVTGTITSEGAATKGFSASANQTIDTVESGGAVAGNIVGGKEGNVHVGGEQQYGDTIQGDKREVYTQGGAYVEGGVEIEGGDFVAGDKVVQGDQVGGDKISIGDISGSSGIAIGRGASAQVTQGIGSAELSTLFAPVLAAIQSAPVEKQQDAQQKVQALQVEVAKGNQADDATQARLIDDLIGLVPGAATALLAAFSSPLLAGTAGPVTDFVLQRIGAM